MRESQVGYPVVLSASGMVSGGTDMARTYPGGSNNPASVVESTVNQGAILGFFCNSTTSGTVVLSFATAAGGAGTAFTGTITPTAGTYYPFPAVSPSGIYCTIANTISVTFFCVE
jgi:hypothetical protein